jgi:hypothetical protein
VLANTRADSAVSLPLLVEPSASGGVGYWVQADDSDDPLTSHARGPGDPPLPRRCCAACDQGAVFYVDPTQATTAQCGGFALTYVDQSTDGWVCQFYATADTEPQAAGGQPSFFYAP